MASRARKDCLAERRRCECYVHCPHYIVLSDNLRRNKTWSLCIVQLFQASTLLFFFQRG